LIAVAAIAAFTLVGTSLSNAFSDVASQLYGTAEPRPSIHGSPFPT
jgi:Flp pilus assembly pilin Flp